MKYKALFSIITFALLSSCQKDVLNVQLNAIRNQKNSISSCINILPIEIKYKSQNNDSNVYQMSYDNQSRLILTKRFYNSLECNEWRYSYFKDSAIYEYDRIRNGILSLVFKCSFHYDASGRVHDYTMLLGQNLSELNYIYSTKSSINPTSVHEDDFISGNSQPYQYSNKYYIYDNTGTNLLKTRKYSYSLTNNSFLDTEIVSYKNISSLLSEYDYLATSSYSSTTHYAGKVTLTSNYYNPFWTLDNNDQLFGNKSTDHKRLMIKSDLTSFLPTSFFEYTTYSVTESLSSTYPTKIIYQNYRDGSLANTTMIFIKYSGINTQ
jgi:hypothetical protein